MAGAEEEIEELREILEGLRKTVVHRAVLAWRISPETFGEEILALNQVDQALKNSWAE